MELTEDYKKEVVGPMKSKRVFVFGDGGRRRSEGKYIIPTDINGQRRTLELDVIRADIPLLLSTAEMKNLDMAVVWYGMVWYGFVWFGMVWFGMAWFGLV